ncbi:hypothetical protein E4T56_gene4994, partial [Termitomyces sp. T112]
MSVNEVDSSVLQSHTNGDIGTTPIIHNEVHDTSNNLKESVQSKEELNVTAGEPVGEATETKVETQSLLASELDNVSNIQAPAAAIIPSDSDTTLVNGDTEAHATDVASSTFEGTEIDASNVITKEQAPNSTFIENDIPEPKANSNQQLAPAEQDETLTETARENSADMVTTSGDSTLNATSIAAVDIVPPTIEVSTEETKPTHEESTNVQSELTVIASTTVVASESTFLAEPMPFSISQEPSPIVEVDSKEVVPDAVSEDTKTEALLIETPSDSAVQPTIEVSSAEPGASGISASQPTEAKSEEATQIEADSNATEIMSVAATTAEVSAKHPAMEVAEAANEIPVVEDSAEVTPDLEVNAVELVTAAVTPEVHETSRFVEPSVAIPPIEATVEPETVTATHETEAVEESIVEPSEEVVHPAVELVTESAAELVLSNQVVPSEETVVKESDVKEESVPVVDDTIVSSEPPQPIPTVEVQTSSEPISEDASAPTEAPLTPLVEKASTVAPSGLSKANDQPTEVELSAGLSADIPSAHTTIQETAVVESATTDAEVHVSAGPPTEVQEPVSVKKEAMAEEAIAGESIVTEGAEPAKEEVAVVDPPVEAEAVSET